jgi:cytochrome c-type biogenesis protein CcmH
MSLRALLIALSLVWALPAAAIGVDVEKLPDPAKEAQARALMKELRCLVCQNQSIEDSDADLARDLRVIVRERLAAGDSPEQVKAYLVDRYGEWVLLRPLVNRTTWILWATPPLVLVLGGVVLVLLRRRKVDTAPALSAEERAALDELEPRR